MQPTTLPAKPSRYLRNLTVN